MIWSPRAPTSRAYPRRCGGTQGGLQAAHGRAGLSPQVRGNRWWAPARWAEAWPIPAGAGEPSRRRRCARRIWAYPRRCGGTQGGLQAAHGRAGLSPQVRGNRYSARPGAGADGPIPAGAGEPPVMARFKMLSRAYPRRCGGTQGLGETLNGIEGLSPQVRGNQTKPARTWLQGGPIPAGAGEPPKGKTLVLLDIRCQRAREALICTSVSGRVRRTSNAVS